jgi:hypothetical protein
MLIEWRLFAGNDAVDQLDRVYRLLPSPALKSFSELKRGLCLSSQ